MMRLFVTLATGCVLISTPAANVESANDHGFSVVYDAVLPVAPQVAYDKFLEIGHWWSPEHSYSGDAGKLYIDPSPGGGWGEKLPGGFVRHLDLINAEPGKLLVFRGGLGPLAFMGVAGAMTVSFDGKDKGTHVTLRYAVGGYDPDGFKALPAAVDKVLGANFDSFTTFAAK